MKSVLIIEDEPGPSDRLRLAFERCAELKFSVSVAGDLKEAEALLREGIFDVVTVDLSFEGVIEAGLEFMEKGMVFASCPDAVKIVVTAFPSYERCVQAMRLGAWDFIRKQEEGYDARAVESAVGRLQELEALKREEQYIYDEWLPQNQLKLQQDYSGEYVAIKDGQVVAHGQTMIALGASLAKANGVRGRLPYVLCVEGRRSDAQH